MNTYLQALPHGTTLSCRSAGEPGRPVLLFLHGFPEAAFIWDGLLTHFARPENGGFRCVAPNLRGYEHSSSPTEVSAYRAKHLVQDITALIQIETRDSPTPGQVAGLIAHDWGGAVAWNLAALQPALLHKLVIVNSPHPGAFCQALAHDPAQQAASAYMNFLATPEAPALLAHNDFERLWPFFTGMGHGGTHLAWLDEAMRERFRAVWRQGLHGPCAYYAASPLRPPTAENPGAAAVQLPRNMLEVNVPTLVVWGMDDTALPPSLLDGLDGYVADLRIERVPGATHWIVHEQPERVAQLLTPFLRGAAPV
ncbi:alpha/beta fold hydrolase [Hydrogenophaga sp.]|uniref:alpha/beta fold hydrolase n=1 Tax=Hydrogenophaga sp. TaxID=1904254 RepID=UPI003566A8EC